MNNPSAEVLCIGVSAHTRQIGHRCVFSESCGILTPPQIIGKVVLRFDDETNHLVFTNAKERFDECVPK